MADINRRELIALGVGTLGAATIARATAQDNGTATAGTIVLDIQIAASQQAVWDALTDPTKLVQWFPLDAQVTPGVGGKIRLSWNEYAFEQRIDVWKPAQRLRVTEIVSFGGPSPQPRTIDYSLKSDGGNTWLHLEHAGFDDAATPPEATVAANSIAAPSVSGSVSDCWVAQTAALKLYLEEHQGETRTMAWARVPFNGSLPEAWARLTGPRGIVSSGKLSRLEAREKYFFQAPNGDKFSGRVLAYTHNRQFVGSVDNMNDGMLRIVLDHVERQPGVTVSLASYGKAHVIDARLFEARWTKLLGDVLA